MIDEADWSRIARYFAGECSPAEAEATRQWLAGDPSALDAEQLRSVWDAAPVPAPLADTDNAWRRLSARMQATQGPSPVSLHHGQSSTPRPRFHWRQSTPRVRAWTLAAASLVLAAGGGGTLAWLESHDAVSSRIEQRIAEHTAPDREFRTVRGQRAVVVLGDGTRIELGAASTLRVRAFGAGPREVFLDGEAVFDVVHDPAHVFLVHSKNAIAEDMGTRFVVRAYPADVRVEVFVSSGKVNLRAVGAPASSGTLLGPLDLGVLDSIGHATVRNGADSASHLAWTHDRFVFSSVPLTDVLADVARWFDVRIDVRDSAAAHKRVTMSVPARSLSDVLGAATVPLGLHYEITGRTVVVR
jgi:transmembrane sensor